jgi:putative DNA primase/helicase
MDVKSRGSRGGSDDDRVRVIAWARTTDSQNWHRLLKFRDRDRKRHTLLLKPEQESKSALCKLLKRHGYTVPTDDKGPERLVARIVNANPKRRVLLVERPGWHSDQFKLGSKTVGDGKEPIILGDKLGSHVARVAQRGAFGGFEGWKDNIAGVASTTSSYLVFALSVGFAAPLLHLTGVHNGGFHFWAPSARGKSTAQACAATIFGSGEGRGNGYSRTWETTDTAVEERGCGHCDLPFILDEIQTLDSNPKAAAQRASKIIYSLASGTWKARSGRYTGQLAGDLNQYRTLVLSSGEDSLAEHSRVGGARRQDGEAVRLIDVPVPKRATGIFDRLPKGSSGVDSGILASALERDCVLYYGTAGRVYISKLVRQVRRDRAGLAARLDSRMEEFLTKSRVDRTNGYAVRFARRFALAYAAGLLAIDYGVVPSGDLDSNCGQVFLELDHIVPVLWDRDLVYRSIRRVYQKAWRQRTGSVDPVDEEVNKAVREVQRTQVVDLTGKNHRVSARQAKDARVLLITHSDGLPLRAVRPDYFRSLVGPLVSPIKVAKELETRKLLIPRGNGGRRTRQVPIPGSDQRQDRYCLRLPDPQTPSPKNKARMPRPRLSRN